MAVCADCVPVKWGKEPISFRMRIGHCGVYGRFALLAAVDLSTESPLLNTVYGPEIPIGFNVVIPG
jgi:hypothetical protein